MIRILESVRLLGLDRKSARPSRRDTAPAVSRLCWALCPRTCGRGYDRGRTLLGKKAFTPHFRLCLIVFRHVIRPWHLMPTGFRISATR